MKHWIFDVYTATGDYLETLVYYSRVTVAQVKRDLIESGTYPADIEVRQNTKH